MIKNNNDVEWILIEDKIKKEWEKSNGKKKEKKERNIKKFKKFKKKKKNITRI